MKTRMILVWMLVSVMVSGGCKDKDNRSSNTNVTRIVIMKNGNARYTVCYGRCVGTSGASAVTNTVSVCKNEVVTSLEAVFTCEDPKATVSPTGPQDFTTPQTFTVTAENGTQRSYTIIVSTDLKSCD